MNDNGLHKDDALIDSVIVTTLMHVLVACVGQEGYLDQFVKHAKFLQTFEQEKWEHVIPPSAREMANNISDLVMAEARQIRDNLYNENEGCAYVARWKKRESI